VSIRILCRNHVDEDWSVLQTLRMNSITDPSVPDEIRSPAPAPAPASASASAPAPDLERLSALTRDYARLSHDQGGWAGICGGIFLLAVAAVEVWGQGWGLSWRTLWIGSFSPQPLRTGLVLLLLPLLWIALRALLLRHIQDRYGAVAPRIESDDRRERELRVKNTIARVMLPLIMLGGIWMLTRHPLPAPASAPVAAPALDLGLRIVAILALASGLCVLLPRWEGRTERMVGILLFIAPVCVLAGFQMGADDTMLAFPIIGLISIGKGVRDYRQFRATLRELA